MTFFNQYWLYIGAFATLLAVAVSVWSYRTRLSMLGRFVAPKLVDLLSSSTSRGRIILKQILVIAGIAALFIALARPQYGYIWQEAKSRGIDIVFAVDTSNSMLAKDVRPDRLSRAKLAISRLVDRLHDDRIGLVIFAGTSFVQLPVTADYISAKMFLGEVDTGSIPIQGTAIGDAIITAARGFSPQSEKSRAIIVISDGENHEDDAVEAAKTVADSGIKVYTIGVGSAEGEPIPMGGDLLKDKNGEIVVTRLNEQMLKEIAAAGGGSYVHAGNQEFGLNPIIDEISMMEDERLSSIVFEEYDELYMYFLGIALGIFVIEMLIGERRAKRRIFR